MSPSSFTEAQRELIAEALNHYADAKLEAVEQFNGILAMTDSPRVRQCIHDNLRDSVDLVELAGRFREPIPSQPAAAPQVEPSRTESSAAVPSEIAPPTAEEIPHPTDCMCLRCYMQL